MRNFWAITTFFNPAGYKTLLNNYYIFAENLAKQGVNLLTVEVAFDGKEHEIPLDENVVRVRSNSIMFLKENLINVGVKHLPSDCKYFGWVDCDLIWQDDNWVGQAINKFESGADILQLYKKIYYLPPKTYKLDGSKILAVQGVIWQAKIHHNWLQRRKRKDLPFSAPGFAFAMTKSFFNKLNKIYDSNIVGSGDTFFVDCLLDSESIHAYWNSITDAMRSDMSEYKKKLKQLNPKVDYIPQDIMHLFHGSLSNRGYRSRHNIVVENDFDPKLDIKLNEDGVYEWSSNKPQMHDSIKQYFFDRKEDEV